MLNEEFLSLVDNLSQKDKRRNAAKRIAEILGVNDIIFFLLDMEVNVYIPAPGMASILPCWDQWQEFLSNIHPKHSTEAVLPWPDSTPLNERSLVVGIKSISDSTELKKTCVIAFQGIPESSQKLRHLINLLPLVATCIQFEWLAIKTKKTLASQGIQVKKSNDLLNQLEHTRQDLQQSLYLSQVALNTRNEFLAIASHELKTPLTCVVLETSILKRLLQKNNSFENEIALNRVASLEAQLKRMTVLIDNLLDYSQVAEGQMNYESQETNLTELTREIVDRFDKQAMSVGSSLYFTYDGPAITYCDRSKIDQAISNLISNAIKYGDSKKITVGVSSNKNRRSIFVEDQGIGIPVDDQKKIFERFERSNVAMRFNGFGLGLFVVKKIIDAHQGSIEVESTLEQGSRFTIHLPDNLSHKELE